MKASAGVEVPAIEAAVDESWPGSPPRAPTAEEMERAPGAQLEREWLDRLGTVARPRGRTSAGTRGAVRRPQLALTAVQRVLEVTAEEVQAVASERLRPDNRAVLVYEPVDKAADGQPTDSDDQEEGTDQ